MSDRKTPRTDGEEVWAEWNREQFTAVNASLARELERELDESRELAIAAIDVLLRWSSGSFRDDVLDESLAVPDESPIAIVRKARAFLSPLAPKKE